VEFSRREISQAAEDHDQTEPSLTRTRLRALQHSGTALGATRLFMTGPAIGDDPST
jgi:hypothetical protein